MNIFFNLQKFILSNFFKQKFFFNFNFEKKKIHKNKTKKISFKKIKKYLIEKIKKLKLIIKIKNNMKIKLFFFYKIIKII